MNKLLINNLVDKARDFLATQAALKEVPTRQLRLEAQTARQLTSLYQKAFRELVTQIEKKGIPSDRSFILAALRSLKPDVAAILFGGAQTAYGFGDERTVTELAVGGIESKGVPLSQATLSNLKSSTLIASDSTISRMIGNIDGLLTEVYRQGLSHGEAANLLRGKFRDMANYELNRIARTEVQRIQNKSAHETILDAGVFEQWKTAGDDKVRDLHMDLDGQITRPNGMFSNGLRYPLDPAGSAEEVVNCRCRTVPFIMPSGMMAPPNKEWFYEADLIRRKN